MTGTIDTNESLVQAGLDARIQRIQTLHNCAAINRKKAGVGASISYEAIIDHVEKCLMQKGLFERR